MVERIQDAGGKGLSVRADVTKPEDAANLVREAIEELSAAAKRLFNPHWSCQVQKVASLLAQALSDWKVITVSIKVLSTSRLTCLFIVAFPPGTSGWCWARWSVRSLKILKSALIEMR